MGLFTSVQFSSDYKLLQVSDHSQGRALLVALIAGLAFIGAFPKVADAHDPGLSGSVVQTAGEQVICYDSFAWKDIDRLVRVDQDGDGKVSGAEVALAQEELEELGAGMFSLSVEGIEMKRLSTHAAAGADSNGDMVFTSVYARPRLEETTVLTITFTGLERFASGHRHVLEVQDEQGAAILRDLLGRGHASAQIALPAATNAASPVAMAWIR